MDNAITKVPLLRIHASQYFLLVVRGSFRETRIALPSAHHDGMMHDASAVARCALCALVYHSIIYVKHLYLLNAS